MILSPNTYSVPRELELEAAWRTSWAGWLVSAIFIAAFVWAVVATTHDGTFTEQSNGIIFFAGVVLSAIAVSGFATWYGFTRKPVSYEIRGMRVVFTDRNYYVPPNILEAFVEEKVCAKFRPYIDTEPWDYLDGVLLVSAGHDLRVGDKDVLGMTYADYAVQRRSIVEANRLLDGGVGAWELKLQIMHRLFPGQSEKLDIKWLRAKGI